MVFDKERKKEIMQEFGKSPDDTGSAQVQIALITARIKECLTAHCKTHAKDRSSHRGMMGLLARRRKFLAYLKRDDLKSYKTVVKKLGLKER